MKNFGKLTPTPSVIEVPGDAIGLNEDGSFIFGPSTSYNVILYKNKDGVDINDLAKDYPHPFYIAITDENVVVSMVDDVEESQIGGLEIIGIDNDFGFSYGPGGTVYGKHWNGSEIVDPPKRAGDVDIERDRRTVHCFTFKGNPYQLDDKSIANITAMGSDAKFAILNGAVKGDVYWVNPNTAFTWITTDNRYITMDAYTMSEFTDASKIWVSEHIYAARTLKDMTSIPRDFTDDKYWPLSHTGTS